LCSSAFLNILTAYTVHEQVKEALMTSALLKLPQKISRAKKEERVEQILEELVSPSQHCEQVASLHSL
jgi:hypothetical protein